jgi:hypothetical protein
MKAIHNINPISLLDTLVSLERQYRQRMAGLRTNVGEKNRLVSS